MKITCLNCGKKINVEDNSGICRFCGYYNRQYPADYHKNNPPENAMKETKHAPQDIKGEFILSDQSKKIFLRVMVCVFLAVQIVGGAFYLYFRCSYNKKSEQAGVIEPTYFTGIGSVLALESSDTLQFTDCYRLDWGYEGLPDGYQLICVPYVFNQQDYACFYDVYLYVAGYYIEPVREYILESFTPSEYVEKMQFTDDLDNGSGTLVFLVPAEYDSGEIAIYSSVDDTIAQKLVGALSWTEVR